MKGSVIVAAAERKTPNVIIETWREIDFWLHTLSKITLNLTEYSTSLDL